MNVLVVGGAGYIGSHCVRQALAAGHAVAVLDDLSYGHAESVPAGVRFFREDMGDEPAVRSALRACGPDVVIDFAAFTNVGESVQQPERYHENNVVRTEGLLRAMLAEGVRQLVFSSTCATYGIPDRMPMTEDLPQRPINPYGATKLAVERRLRELAATEGLSFAAFRYFNAAGASADAAIGEDHAPETHLIPLAIAAALGRRPPLQVFGDDYPTPDGTCLRDYVHVDDLSRAHLDVLPKLDAPGQALFYNLGTGTPYSVKDVIASVGRILGRPVPHEFAPRREGDPPALYADASKVRRELGWAPRYDSLDAIVRTACAWHLAHPRGFAS
ncbi:MAG: UDP-glucose 4-epimerase [Verrucomicrobiota bacterium]|jgi:UDP-glucose 4-epimerase